MKFVYIGKLFLTGVRIVISETESNTNRMGPEANRMFNTFGKVLE